MQVWENLLSQLDREWGKETVDRWLRSLKVIGFDAANLHLEAENSFQISWYEEHLYPRLYREPLINNNGRPIRIHLSSSPVKKGQAKPVSNQAKAIQPDSLDPEMILENFLPSDQNAMAVQMTLDVCTTSFSPIYLFGPKDAGKTHLLMAAAKLLEEKGKEVFFVRAETFTEHVVQAIRLGHMQELRRAYRSATALIVDDIHIFARKGATQEEFFHTFNDLHTRGCPILLSSRVPPFKLTDIEPRLVSRFEWGITIGMQQHDLKQILEKKASLWKLQLHPELLPYLLETFPSSAIMALAALSFRSVKTETIHPLLAGKLLQDLIEKEKQNAWTPDAIVKVIAAHFGIPIADLLGKSQTQESVLPRQVAMYLCRIKLKLPFQKIGAIFGRDHSTVMSSVKTIQKEIDAKKPEFLNAIIKVQEGQVPHL